MAGEIEQVQNGRAECQRQFSIHSFKYAPHEKYKAKCLPVLSIEQYIHQ